MPDDPRSDTELVTAINRGDREAFEALYRRYRDWTLRLARRLTGHDDDALDVLQETFIYVASKFPGFELRARFTTFLYPAVRNLSIEAGRRSRRQRGEAGEVLVDLAAPEDLRGEHARQQAELAGVLAGLPPGHREVLLLRYLDDFSLEEIAAACGIPVGTVKSRIHNALARLREDPRARRYFDAEEKP